MTKLIDEQFTLSKLDSIRDAVKRKKDVLESKLVPIQQSINDVSETIINKLRAKRNAIDADIHALNIEKYNFPWFVADPIQNAKNNAERDRISRLISAKTADRALVIEEIDRKFEQFKSNTAPELKDLYEQKKTVTEQIESENTKLTEAKKKYDDFVGSLFVNYANIADIKYDLYLMASGEIEARNTAARLRLSAEERQRTPPSVTADIEAAYAILMGEPGVSAQSLPPGQQPPVRPLNPPGTVVNQSPQFPKPSPPGVLPGTNVPLNQPPPIVAGKKKRASPIRGPISGKSKWRTVEDVTESLISTINNLAQKAVPWSKASKRVATIIGNPSKGKARRALLATLTLRQLADITRTQFPQLLTAINIVDKMTSFRLGKLGEAQIIAKDWLDAQNKKPEQSTLVGKIMLDATINGKDPDKGPTTPKLDAAWASLDPEFQDIYRRVRDYFQDNLQEMIRELKKRALHLPKADRQKAIRKINEQFAPDKLVSPYFPLRRFGEYWFQVGTGPFKEFYEFESEFSREASRLNRIQELRDTNRNDLADTVDYGAGISELFSKNLASTKVLKDVQELIDSIIPPKKPGAAPSATATKTPDEYLS